MLQDRSMYSQSAKSVVVMKFGRQLLCRTRFSTPAVSAIHNMMLDGFSPGSDF
jgi:hypothetical protein